ncbi:MAG TPA: aldo/keto reductase [Bacteroidales bacterium]|nr:aldo/keto reductase [Bacteroidales bacterium]
MQRPTYITGDHSISKYFNNGPRLVCGTSGLGGVCGKTDEAESIDIMLYALERDVRAFDTAPSYNNAQEYLGKTLKRWNGPLPFISTRVGRLKAEKAEDEILDYRPEIMRKSLLESLDLMGIGKIDLLFLHEPYRVPPDKMDEILDTLKGFKEEGLTDFVGLGGNPPIEFHRYVRKENFDVLSGWLKLNACNLDALKIDIPLIKREGIGYYNASVLHAALLGTRLEQYSRERPNSASITNKDVDTAVMASRIAARNRLTLPGMAFRFALSMEESDRVVIGTRKMYQMKEAIDSWNAGPLPEKIFNEIIDNILKFDRQIVNE